MVFIASVLWAIAYDTEYAMADRDDDLKIGVKSTAILFGDADVAIIGIVQSMVLFTMVLAGRLLELGAFYYASLIIAALMVVHQLIIIRKREPHQCIRAFLNNHYLGMTVFIGIVLDYLFSHPGLNTLVATSNFSSNFAINFGYT